MFKKDERERENPGNYRRVILTSVVKKLLESIIKDEVNEHLEDFQLMRENQHGFVKGKSRLTKLIEFCFKK